MTNKPKICCLCNKPATDDNPISKEHVPPKQFYPKSIRSGLNLWNKIPTHKVCNASHKLNEEYFYHALFPLVANANPQMATVILDDLKRRSQKPPTPGLLRQILSTERDITDGGIVLPPGLVRLDIDNYRVEQVALKIGRCLFWRDKQRYMPTMNCKDIRLCENIEDVPELYQLSWELSKVNVRDFSKPEHGEIVTDDNEGQPKAACHQVFSYRSAYLEKRHIHLYTMLFFEAFYFCITFSDPDVNS